jgi:transposase
MGIYSRDLRTRAVAAVDRDIARREVFRTFSISLTTLKRWLKRTREGKDLSPGVSTGRKRRILATLGEEGFVEATQRERRRYSGASLRAVGRGRGH